jgi:hypothetical protein
VTPSPRTLHEQSIVIDLVCPLASTERYLYEWIRGGARSPSRATPGSSRSATGSVSASPSSRTTRGTGWATVHLSHTGHRPTMEAMEVSRAPCIFSHANAYVVHDCGRNIRDDQIKAVAAMGGVIGLNGFFAFVSARRWPTVDELVKHAVYIADKAGVDHLSVGIDYYQDQWPFIGAAEAKAMYAVRVREGRWNPKNYPPPLLLRSSAGTTTRTCAGSSAWKCGALNVNSVAACARTAHSAMIAS